MELRTLFCLFALLLNFNSNSFAENDVLEKRIAIVIVNEKYENTKSNLVPLKKGIQLSNVLKQLDFEVIEGYNLSHQELTSLLQSFSVRLQSYDVSFLYYAGLAIQFDGMNYLVSPGSQATSIFDFHSNSISLDKIIDVQQRNERVNIVYFDATSDPLLNTRISENLEAIDFPQLVPGITSIRIPLKNTVFMASSATNTQLELSLEKRSAFVDALINHLPTANVEISQMVKRVIRDVRKQSDNEMNPVIKSALVSSFYFKNDKSNRGGPSVNDKIDIPKYISAAFAEAQEINDVITWQAFLKHFGDSPLADKAREKLRKIELEKPPAETANIELSTKKQIQELQTHLAKLSCDPGPIDGVWGQRGEASLKRLKAANLILERFKQPNKPLLEYISKNSLGACK